MPRFWKVNFEKNGRNDIRFGSNKTLKTFARDELVGNESLTLIDDNREKAEEVINLKYIFETNWIKLDDLLDKENCRRTLRILS